MLSVISSEKLPIKIWASDLEESALLQAKNLANLPFAFKHIAIMPDSHFGYGMPIGGVLATKNVIIPNAVGVDIGCGMSACKTSLKEINIEIIKKIMGEIRQEIPIGFNHHSKKQDESLMPELDEEYIIVKEEYEKALTQISTLGGGNHFIELQKDMDGFIWIMIHSGSRNFGLKIANYYNNLAKDLNIKWHSAVPKEHDLAFLPIDSNEGQWYLKEMQYAVDFAYVNRYQMIRKVIDIINNNYDDLIGFEQIINIAHNYVIQENHFGENVWVHRKGATLARKDTIGIIPGSQGTKSYIVKGLENPQSFNSCSHGAGRRIGRKQAQRELNLEEEIKKMDSQGIIHGIRNKKDLDEAPSSYKNIDSVMKNQSDLVEILVELKPIAVIKA